MELVPKDGGNSIWPGQTIRSHRKLWQTNFIERHTKAFDAMKTLILTLERALSMTVNL